jgi:hypothetical protein
MATEIVERKLDDVYRVKGVRKEADVTVEFAYKGRSFVIDLTKGNEAEFDDAIEPFLEAATEVTGRRKVGTIKKSAPPATSSAPKKKAAVKSGGTPTEADAIREWARSQGLQVSDRGRIADSVKAAYYAGHPKPGVPAASLENNAVSAELEPEVEETEVEGDFDPYDEDPYGQL